MNSGALYLILTGFLSGLIVSEYSYGSLVGSLFLFLSMVFLFFHWCFSKNHFLYFGTSIFLISMAVGIFRVALSSPPVVPDIYLKREINFVGRVLDMPKVTEQTIRFPFLVTSFEGEGVVEKVKILITADKKNIFYPGDILSVKGKLVKPSFFKTEDDYFFDWPGFLEKEYIFYEIRFPREVTLLDANPNLLEKLRKMPEIFRQKVDLYVPEPAASLAVGTLLGIPIPFKDINEKFRLAGISHIVVLSGYNISLLIGFIFLFSRFIKRSLIFVISIVFVLLFVLMVGGSPPILRAGLMAILVIAFDISGRPYVSGRILWVTALFLLFINPSLFLHDLSFELSFLATAGLIYVAPLLEKSVFYRYREGLLKRLIISTLAAQLFVLPLILYAFGQVSLYALLANILVLPIVPFIMLSAFLTVIFGFFLPTLAFLFGNISYFGLHYVLKVGDFIASLPGASVNVPRVQYSLLLIFYFLLFLVLIWNNESKEKV